MNSETAEEKLIRTRRESFDAEIALETCNELVERFRHETTRIRLLLEAGHAMRHFDSSPSVISLESWSVSELKEIQLALDWMTYANGMKNEERSRRVRLHLQGFAVVGLYDFAISTSRQGRVKEQMRDEHLARKVMEKGIPKSIVDEYM